MTRPEAIDTGRRRMRIFSVFICGMIDMWHARNKHQMLQLTMRTGAAVAVNSIAFALKSLSDTDFFGFFSSDAKLNAFVFFFFFAFFFVSILSDNGGGLGERFRFTGCDEAPDKSMPSPSADEAAAKAADVDGGGGGLEDGAEHDDDEVDELAETDGRSKSEAALLAEALGGFTLYS